MAARESESDEEVQRKYAEEEQRPDRRQHGCPALGAVGREVDPGCDQSGRRRERHVRTRDRGRDAAHDRRSEAAPSPAFGRYFPINGEDLYFPFNRKTKNEAAPAADTASTGIPPGDTLMVFCAALRPLPTFGGQPLRGLSADPDGERIASTLQRTEDNVKGVKQ